MNIMTFAELRDATHALFFGNEEQSGFSSVCIDSRNAEKASLFVALAGSSQDGHLFVGSAFEKGAVAALVAESHFKEDLREIAKKYNAVLFVVEDTLKGLQDAAKAYLEKFPHLLRIGITGSSGKTTTKEITGAIFSSEKSVIMNKGNLNSEIGLPLSVFAVDPCHEVGIFEMGMNRKGEIEELARVLKPHIALITNIGSAHIGLMGDRDAIAAEKKKIFSVFTGYETALIPDCDDYKGFLADGVKGKIVFYGDFAELGEIKDLAFNGAKIIWDHVPAYFRLTGKHNIKNATAAIAIAKEAGISSASIRQGLEKVEPLFGRSEIIEGPVTIVQDCYNANPESTASAIEFCDGVDWSGRRIYVIGSMLELGALSEDAHKGIGQTLSDSRADFVYLFGKETKSTADVLRGKKFFYTENMLELSDSIAQTVQKGDLVLLKGSRGCALERLRKVIDEACCLKTDV
jgi:UDP-N-acetylmuramoyl-tripeptide--D-alanyl-D-alanine ligase